MYYYLLLLPFIKAFPVGSLYENQLIVFPSQRKRTFKQFVVSSFKDMWHVPSLASEVYLRFT